VTDEPKDPASPACLAHEADDTYMGFAGREEIAAFLARLPYAGADDIRKMLPRIRDDALYRRLKERLASIEARESRT
jgi:hypothetical protein